MINLMKPKRIVFIGKKAMDALLPRYDTIAKDRRGHFRLGEGIFDGIPAMGCAHLSGARLSSDDMSTITIGLRRYAAG